MHARFWRDRRWRRLVVAAVPLVLAAPAMAARAPAAGAAPLPPARVLAGWVPYWSAAASVANATAHASMYSSASAFWYDMHADGTVTPKPGSGDIASTVSALHAARVPVLLTVTTGVGAAQMAQLLPDPRWRATHVAALAALASSTGADGVDLDYETLVDDGSPADLAANRAGYVQLVGGLAASMHAQGKTALVTVPPRTSTTDPHWAGYDYAGLGAAADRITVMCYDLHGRNDPAGPVTSVAWAGQVMTFATSQVVPWKVVLGLPTYGYDWPNGQPPATSVTWSQASALLAQYHAVPLVDPTTQQPYFDYTSAGVPHRVWYSTGSSTAALAALVLQDHLAGVSLWTLGYADPATWPAMEQLGNAVVAQATSRFVAATYADILGRDVDPNGLAYWTGLIDSGGATREAAAHALLYSPESLAATVQDSYQRVLGRAADAGGLAYFAELLSSGRMTTWNVRAVLAGSAEFAAGHGGTEAGFVGGLYQLVLGRAADPAGLQYWETVSGQLGPTGTALAMMLTAESLHRELDAIYQRMLKRPADPAGLAYWSPLVAARGALPMIETLAGSAEYFVQAQAR